MWLRTQVQIMDSIWFVVLESTLTGKILNDLSIPKSSRIELKVNFFRRTTWQKSP